MRSRVLPSVFILALATGIVAGCSGGGATVDGSGVGDPDGGGGDSAVTTPPTSDGSVPDAPQGDANPPIDSGVDDRIDPIALGRSWTYDVSIIGTYPLCKSGSNTGRVLGQKVVGLKPSFQVQSFCPGAGTSSYAVNGDRVEVYYNNTWVLSLDAPVMAGHTWTDGLFTYGWESVGSVTVPAGTFNDCWKAKPTVGTSYTTFCRGIGPVQWHYVDGTGNGYDATLTSYTK